MQLKRKRAELPGHLSFPIDTQCATTTLLKALHRQPIHIDSWHFHIDQVTSDYLPNRLPVSSAKTNWARTTRPGHFSHFCGRVAPLFWPTGLKNWKQTWSIEFLVVPAFCYSAACFTNFRTRLLEAVTFIQCFCAESSFCSVGGTLSKRLIYLIFCSSNNLTFLFNIVTFISKFFIRLQGSSSSDSRRNVDRNQEIIEYNKLITWLFGCKIALFKQWLKWIKN